MPRLKNRAKKYCILALAIFLIGCDSNEKKNPSEHSNQSNEVQYDSPVEGNMHNFRVMLETYAFDWYYSEDSKTFKPRYPDSIGALKQESKNAQNDYWQTLTNPVTKTNDALLDFSAYQAGDEHKGKVIYAPIKENDDVVSYLIYATDDQGKLLQKEGFPLTLTNS